MIEKTTPKLNLAALLTADTSKQVLGVVSFNDLNATVYYMVDNEDQRVNSGVSFLYDGGKFSAPIDPVVGKQLSEACERNRITFSRVDLEVTPAALGKDKKPGLKPVRVMALYCGDKPVYEVNPILKKG